MPHVIDKDKARDSILVRLSEAKTGCTVSELLRLAEDGEVLLFAALRSFSAVSANTLGEKHPGIPWMSSGGAEVELLPKHARDIERFGTAKVTHFPANLPDIGDESLWFWRLEEPQTIGIENLFIADGHVSIASPQSTPSGTPESAEPPRPSNDWRESARAIADEFFERDTSSGCRDSMAGYARRVMNEMQKRGIHGPRGLIDNSKTIEREALQGDKWWRHKKK